MRKNKWIRFGVLFLAAAVFLTAAVWAASSFRDVKDGDWYAPCVEYVYEKGLMNGISEDTFEPESTMTRAMFVTVLGRMKGIDPEQYTELSFHDVKQGLWYSPYVAWASENGVVNGMPDHSFHPLDNVTRQDAACMIARYLNAEGISLDEESAKPFPDAAHIASYALESVELMSRVGLIRGDERGNFNPLDNITRAEAATILMRLDQKLEASETEEPSEEPTEPSEEPTEPSEEPTEPPEPDWIELLERDVDGEGWSELIP